MRHVWPTPSRRTRPRLHRGMTLQLAAAQRTWERADLIVCGIPEIPFDPVTEIVVAWPGSLRATGL
jgi:hypothetical protein